MMVNVGAWRVLFLKVGLYFDANILLDFCVYVQFWMQDFDLQPSISTL